MSARHRQAKKLLAHRQELMDARRFAAKVGGYVETWDEFVKLWRTLYPLASKNKPRGGR